MKRFMLFLLCLTALLSLTITGFAQEVENVEVFTHNTSVDISWPGPVTEVWGTGDIIGTANPPDMLYYYLEYKPLNADLSEPENAPWIPLTPAISTPVIEGVLATLDTTDVPDGLYVVRLTVNTENNQSVHYEVNPLRVSNERFSRIEDAIRDDERQQAGLEPEPVPPTATPDVPDDNSPRVTPENFAVNIRRCALVDNNRCPVVASLERELYADVTGVSPDRGWFQIRTESGATGWAKRTVIVESGDFSGVRIVQPPDPLPAPPVIVQPEQPILTSNVIPTGMAIEGGNATCNVTYNVQVNVNNAGNAQSPAGNVTLQDVNVRTGEITANGSAGFPILNAGQNWVVVIPMRTSVYFNEDHELRAFVNGRQFNIRYTLQAGSCANATHLPESPSSGSGNLSSCTVVINSTTNAWDSPNGNVVWNLDAATYPAEQVRLEAGVRWFRVLYADGQLWLPANLISGYVGQCTP